MCGGGVRGHGLGRALGGGEAGHGGRSVGCGGLRCGCYSCGWLRKLLGRSVDGVGNVVEMEEDCFVFQLIREIDFEGSL